VSALPGSEIVLRNCTLTECRAQVCPISSDKAERAARAAPATARSMSGSASVAHLMHGFTLRSLLHRVVVACTLQARWLPSLPRTSRCATRTIMVG
jgi:hypothetical protein